jgi:hypothetical protein
MLQILTRSKIKACIHRVRISSAILATHSDANEENDEPMEMGEESGVVVALTAAQLKKRAKKKLKQRERKQLKKKSK